MSHDVSSPSVSSSQRPKLAYLFARYPVVSQTFVDNEILALEKQGWDVVVVAFNPPYNHFRHPRLQHLKAPVLYAPPPAAAKAYSQWAKEDGTWPDAMVQRHESFAKHSNPSYRARDAAYFGKLLKRLGISHTHTHFTNSAAHAGMYLKEMAGISHSVTPHAQDFMVDINSDELLTEMCHSAEFVIGTCNHARDLLAPYCHGMDDRLIRVYSGIEDGSFPTAKPNPQNRTIRIASVGRMIEFKGFHHLIQAIANAKAQGVTVILDLCGDGPWRERLEKQTQELGLQDQITFHGVVDGNFVRECFSRMDAFALACIMDGKGAADMFPTVVTEAMFSGLPVISSKLVGVPEQVEDGVTGILTEPGDEAHLTEALVRLATEEGLAARMGKASQERARRLFEVSQTLPSIEARYLQLNKPPVQVEPFKILAFYDLADQESFEALQGEHGALDQVQLWVSGAGVSAAAIESLKGHLDEAFWLPDGVALEMEWQNSKHAVEALEKLRFGMSTSIDGEIFFACARRALWIATQVKRLGGVEWLYAPNSKELLTLWMVHHLTGIPFIGRYHHDLLPSKAIAFIQKESTPDCLVEPLKVWKKPHLEVKSGFQRFLQLFKTPDLVNLREQRRAAAEWLKKALRSRLK